MEYEPNEVRVLDRLEVDRLELDRLVLDRLVLSMQECGMLALNRLELDIKELGMLELGRLEFGMLGHKIEETRNPDPIIVVHHILLLLDMAAVVGIQCGSGDTDVVDHADHAERADRADHIAIVVDAKDLGYQILRNLAVRNLAVRYQIQVQRLYLQDLKQSLVIPFRFNLIHQKGLRQILVVRSHVI